MSQHKVERSDSIVVAALYKFVRLDDCEQLREPLLALMLAQDVRGTLLLAAEGINGTISGPRSGIDTVLGWLREDARLADLEHKESFHDEHPFLRTRVKRKKEIVTVGVEGNELADRMSIHGIDAKEKDFCRFEVPGDLGTVLGMRTG